MGGSSKGSTEQLHRNRRSAPSSFEALAITIGAVPSTTNYYTLSGIFHASSLEQAVTASNNKLCQIYRPNSTSNAASPVHHLRSHLCILSCPLWHYIYQERSSSHLYVDYKAPSTSPPAAHQRDAALDPLQELTLLAKSKLLPKTDERHR